MKTSAGLWIDHREAIIVVLTADGEETRRIRSDVEKHLRPSGDPGHGLVDAHQAQADDSREREYTGHLAHYYDEIISHLRGAGTILIFGPGEAKGELKKRFEKHPSDTHDLDGNRRQNDRATDCGTCLSSFSLRPAQAVISAGVIPRGLLRLSFRSVKSRTPGGRQDGH